MKYSTATILIAYFGLTSAAPHQKREVPQEHSHEEILQKVGVSLNLDNPDKIQASVFGLLGDTAAIKGAGNIKNLDCLHQAIADRAFTNEKKAANVDGMANALIFAAVERNTGAVGKASNTCTEKAVNPEIGAISQHQDPAGPGALEANKKIVLALAVQLKSIGADPQLAATSATFASGKLGDPTGAGNTCDDLDDKKGCIFTKKLIQVEATPEEIDAAVKGGDAKGASSAADVKGAGATACPAGAAAGDQKRSENDDKAKGDAGAAAGASGAGVTAGAGATTSAGGDFGSCGSPTVKFADGLDGRKEASFQATNLKDFNHGSALNIKVISDFICGKLKDNCKASADVVDKCNKASLAAQQKKGQESADTFNAGVGGKA